MLTIISADESFAGVYTCRAENIAGFAEDSSLLEVGSSPAIIQSPNNTNIEYEQNGSLYCAATGIPTPSISWSRKDLRPLDETHFIVMEPGRLLVKGATETEEGIYICTAENIFGKQKSEAKITVTGFEPPLLIKNNDIDNELEIIRAVPGEQVMFHCNITQGKPKPRLEWHYKGRPISKDSLVSINENGTLIISEVTHDRAGVYECVATNFIGTVKTNTKLEIFTVPVINPGLEQVEGILGKSVELDCNATGFPSPTIHWERSNLLQLPSNYITSTGGYSIRNITLQDEGTYVCVASNVAGSTSWIQYLNVNVPPKIVSLPIEVFVMEGQVIELDCKMSGKPPPSVSWLKDNKTLLRPEAGYQLLRFSTVKSDTGIYTCIADSSAGSDSRDVNVIVLVPPKIINGGEETLQIVEGGEVKLNCVAIGQPEPVISWHWKEPEHIIVNENNHFSIETNELVIKNASVNLSGVYICDAENSAGIAQKVFHIEVLVLPRILEIFPLVVNLTEGDDYSIPCSATGQPKPGIFWQRGSVTLRPGHQHEDLLVMEDNSLVLTAATLESSGIYSCVAYNAGGVVSRNYSINVLVAPTVTDSSVTRVEIMETTTGKLTCPISAPASVVWLKDGEVLDFKANERADDVHFYTVDNDRTLKIVEARPSDNGIYTCIAKNPAGASEAKFTVEVMIPPYFVNEFAEINFHMNVKDSLTFDCLVAGNPVPKINWRRLEKNLPVTEHTAPGVLLQNSKQKLNISSARYIHSGRYQCVAINKLGRIERIFKLTVIGIPEIDGPDKETVELISGDSYNLTCSVTGIPQPSFSWIHNTQSTDAVIFNETSNIMKLHNVSAVDNGTYSCIAKNVAGSTIKLFSVIILDPPSIQGSDLTEDIKVRSSEQLILSCTLSGVPKPAVTWLRNGVAVKNSIPVINYYDGQNDTEENHVVRLPPIGGKYSCFASNKAGAAEKQFNVKILVAPQLSNQREYYSSDMLRPTEGHPLVIKCPVTGNPQPEIIWLFNGQPISKKEGLTDTIRYSSANYTHSGNYTCFAVNHAGNFSKSFTVDVLVPPKFYDTESYNEFSVLINSTVVLNCSVDGNPYPQILWVHQSVPLPTVNQSAVLVIEKVSIKDSGDYSCLVSNLAGEAEKVFSLQVLDPPAMDEESIISLFNLTVKLHRRVAIKCPLSGSPVPNITWYKDGHVVTSDPKKMIEISQDGKQFQIMFAVAEDAGTYSCVAENRAGIKELHFDLTVVVPLEWSEWAEWNTCSTSCGGGEQERQRYCGGNINQTKEASESDSPLIILDKSNCLGDNMQRRKCNIAPCQIDDGWEKWTDWSECSATCGESTKKRTRECKTIRPAMNGLPCIGSSVQYEICQVPACSYWSEWSEWGDCSVSCGYGIKFRERRCSSPDGNCDGQYRDVVACNMHKCPVNAFWAEWSNWSACSVTCGRGMKQRARICSYSKYNGDTCEGDNIEIKECRALPCHRNVPRLANLRVRGELNGELLENSNIEAEIKHVRGKRVVTATADDILKKQAGWFPYLTFLLPPVNWNVAQEDAVANNGYSLTEGNFEQESEFQFATGHELVVGSKGQGINPDTGALIVDIEVIGTMPMAQPKSSVFIEPFTEDLIQTDKNKLTTFANTTIDVDGDLVPFKWNKNISLNGNLGATPHLVERLSTDNIMAEYNPKDKKLYYSSTTSISSPYDKNTCPKGFILDSNYQHCTDIDECKDSRKNRCHRSQLCENTFGSYNCLCPTGFKAAKNGKRCMDINECESSNLNRCSHFCHNTKGSYKCMCPDGMVLGTDEFTCYDELDENDDYNDDDRSWMVNDYEYTQGMPVDDWRNGASHKQNQFGQKRNFYDEYSPSALVPGISYDNYRSSENQFEELKLPKEGWVCAPGKIKDGDKCVVLVTHTNSHCQSSRCNEHETCLPTTKGHVCIETRCPLNYHQDSRTKDCVQFCQEGVCINGAQEAEEITFIPLPLEFSSIQRYQDLMELSIQDSTASTVFTITENLADLPLRVRIENGIGVLYALKYFNVEGIDKIIVTASSFNSNSTIPILVNTFVIFLYDPSLV